MRSPADALLYAIIDLGYVSPENAPRNCGEIGHRWNRHGAVARQESQSRRIEFTRGKALATNHVGKIPLIANDHSQIAQRVDVQGVHVGQDDESIETVRAQINRPIVVGKSTHSVEQAVAAEREGADYIGFGPIFSTPTKPDYPSIGLSQIREVHKRVSIPIFCIGGIKLENLAQVLGAGAKRVVIVSGLLQADDIT